MSRAIKNAKTIQSKSRSHQVSKINDTTYTVKSGSSNNTYTITLVANGGTCTCDWAKYRSHSDRRSACSHVVSVYNHIAQEANRTASAWSSEEEAKRQHRPITNIGDGITLSFRKAGN